MIVWKIEIVFTTDLEINFKNESIFWTLFIFINAELGNLGIEGLKDKIY